MSNNRADSNNSPDTANVTEQALEQAARWFVDLQEQSQPNEKNQQALSQSKFNRWLKIPANQQAWQQISQIHQQYQHHQNQFNDQALDNNHSANLLYNNVNLSRRGVLKSFAGLSGAAWLGWQGYQSAPLRNQLAGFTADMSSAIGQSKQITLSNNTQIWLNTNTAINTMKASAIKNISLKNSAVAVNNLLLVKGEVYLENNKSGTTLLHSQLNDKLLTLSVNSSDARCSMQLNEDQSQCYLSLYQGSARIDYQGQSRQLISGQQLLLSADISVDFSFASIGEINLASANTTAITTVINSGDKPPWLSGQLHADDISLADFVSQLSRYRRGYIRLQPELMHLRVAGVYPAFDSDAALNLLAQALPIEINYLTPWFVTIAAKTTV